MEQVERVKKAIAYLKGQLIIKYQKDVAKAMNYNEKNLSSAINGDENYLTENFLIRFCDTFDVIDEDWLLTGKGEMTNDSQMNEVNDPIISYSLIEELESKLIDKDKIIKGLEEVIKLLKEKIKARFDELIKEKTKELRDEIDFLSLDKIEKEDDKRLKDTEKLKDPKKSSKSP